jgi:cysteine-rich repeat protein
MGGRRWRSLLAAAAAVGGCNLLAGIDEPRHLPACGDGAITEHEACDDGNPTSGDGCSADCEVEPGFACTGTPSTCRGICGDGVIVAGEACDDGNAASHDGCSAACEVEHGFACAGAPSACQPICGDGIVAGAEGCDDGDPTSGDGCDAVCKIEHGFTCAGAPSACHSTCGDGLVAADEGCDDHGTTPGDGCDASCQVEQGFTCAGEPSNCLTTCGDGKIAPGEQCDDGNAASGDGCDAACQLEAGFTCAGEPTACTPICGDGLVVKGEGCDDQNTTGSDGCSAACQVEAGFQCGGQPSVCGGICGDGVIVKGEQCDDGNAASGDCCSSSCQVEPGCLFEVEPNSTAAEADARAMDPVPLALTGSGKIKGALNPAGDVDYFVMNLAPASSVTRIEVFDGSGKDCAGIATRLQVFNPPMVPSLYVDLTHGIGSCSAVVASLAAGSYQLKVSSPTSVVVPAYLLEVKLQNNLGSEIEPNDTAVSATALLGSDSYISGSHQTAADVDYYAFTVPVGTTRSVRAEIIEGNAVESCESGGIQSRLTLINSASAVLVDDDPGSGRGACSLIDGTGSAPTTMSLARDLAPGKYYLRVQASQTAVGSGAQFDYKLSVVLR